MNSLTQSEWRSRKIRHEAKVAWYVAERLERMAGRVKHPVHDFLFEYFSFRPSQLLRWSPGPDILLEGAGAGDVEWKELVAQDGGLILPSPSFPDHRMKFLEWAIGYLEGIADRPALFNCLGLHEWAMVYRSPEIRHPATPLRLPRDQIAEFVDREGLRCTHFDAFRFFTPEAAPLNRLQLTHQDTAEHDQKGCVHVTMDLYKYAYKLAPWSSGELIADAFVLAWEARQFDMRASPYDLSRFGLQPICIETRKGREEFIELQRELSEKAEPVRERLIGEYRRIRDRKLRDRLVDRSFQAL